MAKINITTPTGNTESLSLLSAFKAEGNTYIVFDSERTGSMGLPIIYISKYTTKLEKITDQNEWQTVKNYLKGIINGTNFEYINIGDNLTSDEAFYTPLTLPTDSFDILKKRYVVNEVKMEPEVLAPAEPVQNLTPTPPVVPNVDVAPVNTAPAEEGPLTIPEEAPKQVEPIMPSVTPMSNNVEASTVVPAQPEPINIPKEEPVPLKDTPNLFENDKATFLKACENMFDALISKYQKELNDLETKKEELAKKEQEVNAKLASASEHLANAEAREQVANIAHDNAQKVMDINNFMPVNPANQ